MRKPKSPYQRYNKRPWNYQGMYQKAPHLRHFLWNPLNMGSYAPHVNNPSYVAGTEPEEEIPQCV